MDKNKNESWLTAADKKWITNLIITAIKPIQEDISEIKDHLSNVEDHLEAIENCPTIQKELK